MPFTGQPYRLGLDLQWWVELDYKVDLEEVKKEPGYNAAREDSIIEGLKSIVDKRVEALRINDSVITTASYGWEKHIIVQIPLKWKTKEDNDLNIKRAKEAIGRVMRIEFKEQRIWVTQEDREERQTLAENLLQEALGSRHDFALTQHKYSDSYEWISIGTLTGTLQELESYFSLSGVLLQPGLVGEVVSGSGVSSLLNETGYWIIDINSYEDDILNFDYAFVDGEPTEWKPALDSLWRALDDKYFVTSSVQYNQAYQPMVELVFNDEWAKIFGELSKRLKGKQMAIFVWGEMLTAPVIQDEIVTWKAVITGNYTPKEAQELSSNINTGVVPAPIYLTSERSIDSKLGDNSLWKLIDAGIYGFILIVLFLVIAYRVGWFLSAIALFMYITIVLAIVKTLWIVLTLAGIAGLILSVGMAIDANILIFERIKDELANGKKLDKAIAEWFDRSWSAIWDSNLTGILISVILFIFWINMIKWFGLILGIWLILSLFSAMFISRLLILLVAEKYKNIDLETFFGSKKKKKEI